MSSDEETTTNSRLDQNIEQRISKLVKQNQVLKAAYLQEQKAKNEIQAKFQELQIDFKSKMDEIDNLNFNNARLSKRIDSLQEQLNAKGAQKGGSFLGGFLNTKDKDLNQRLAKELEVLQEELAIKIEENEQLHISMFEYKQDQAKKLKEVEDKLESLIDVNNELSKTLETFKNEHQSLKIEVDDLTQKRKALESELNTTIKKLIDSEAQFKIDARVLNDKIVLINGKYTRKVPFDDLKNDTLMLYNRCYYKKEAIGKQQEWMQRGIGATKQVIKHLDTVYEDFRARVRMFISQANNEGNENYRMVSNKFIEKSETVYNNIKTILIDAQEVFSFFSELQPKDFAKRPEEVEAQVNRLHQRYETIVANLGILIGNLKTCSSFLRRLYEEEYQFIDNFGLLKKKNSKMIDLVADIERQLETLKAFITTDLHHPTGNKSLLENQTGLQERIIQRLKNLKKACENLYNECREKLQAENLAFEISANAGGASKNSAAISYNFSSDIANGFKACNNNCVTHFSYLVQSFSSVISILEQLGTGAQTKEESGNSYPSKYRTILSLDSGYAKNLTRINALNMKLRAAPSGISYNESLKNKESLRILTAKESEYKHQIESLQMALRNAESMIEVNPEDSVSHGSESTADIAQDRETKLELERVRKNFEALLGKYQEVCAQQGIQDDFTKKLLSDGAGNAKVEHILFENNSGHPYQSHNENVLQGYQRLTMQLLDGKLKSVPLNTITMVDMENTEKYQLWFEKVKQKIVELAQQAETYERKLDDLKQQSEVLRETITQETQQREKAEKRCKELEKNLSKSTSDIDSIKGNYEEQIKTLSEHVLSLQSKKK